MLISRISGCKDRAFNGGGKIFKVFFVQLLSSLYYPNAFFHLFYFSFSKILLCFFTFCCAHFKGYAAWRILFFNKGG